MDDREILSRVKALMDEEHDLRRRVASGQDAPEDDRAALRAAEEELDQCWDLLRQRRASREFAADPDSAQARPVAVVEGYLQ